MARYERGGGGEGGGGFSRSILEGPRAPAVKAGCITRAWRVRAAPLSPVVGQSDFACVAIRLCSC